MMVKLLIRKVKIIDNQNKKGNELCVIFVYLNLFMLSERHGNIRKRQYAYTKYIFFSRMLYRYTQRNRFDKDQPAQML